MARGRHPTWRDQGSGPGPGAGAGGRNRHPSRGLIIGSGALIALALTMGLAGVIAAASFSRGAPIDDYAPLPAGPSPTAQPASSATPRPKLAADDPGEAAPEIQIEAGVAAPTETSSTVESPRTAASSWSAGPTPAPAAPAAPATAEAERLAAEASETYGVRIVLEGEDWGAGEAAQAANIQAVISAIDRLPDTVISAVVAHPYGPLTFVSNDDGRTLDGWQPYGDHAVTYYTNSDQGPDGRHASNQVVLSVGASSMSIGHEILHAYQFRDVEADRYALALLEPEMGSFMEAVGWRQAGSDEDVRQAVNQPWSALDALYVYEGEPLTYTTASGVTSTVTAANPAEAFAIAGAFYYARPSWLPLPDWPAYWGWFRANFA